MYLSKLTLSPHHKQAQTDLASPYQLHKTLANAFPDPESERHRARHGILFRVEEPTSEGTPVLVQSTTEPDWHRLPQGYVLRLDGPKPFAPTFSEGQHLRFRLVANPVRRVRVEGKDNPRRCALIHPRAKDGVEMGYLDWLGGQLEGHEQFEGYGAEVLEVADAPFRLGRKRKVGQGEIPKGQVPHFGVRFDGLLRVTDPTKLGEAVRSGIGPAKAFGFGMLSLAPAG